MTLLCKLDPRLPLNGLERPKGDVPFVTVHNGDSAVRVRQFVVIAPARIDESGLFQPFDKFVRRHEMIIRIMRITSM